LGNKYNGGHMAVAAEP